MILTRVQARLSGATEFHKLTGMPFCTITYAQGLDGSIGASTGRCLAISGKESLKMTHHLRAHHDAILVGVDTVLTDDPLLTVRLVEGTHPQPIVLDTNLRFPAHARMLANPKKPWVVTGEQINAEAKAELEQKGARVLPARKNEKGQIDLPRVLRRLGEMGIRSVMVEGGARVIASFLAHRLGHQLVVTIGPRFVGGIRPVGGTTDTCIYPNLGRTIYEQWGPDMVLAADLEWKSDLEQPNTL